MLEPIKSNVTYETKVDDDKIHYLNLEGVFEGYGSKPQQQRIVQYRVLIPGEFASATVYKNEQNGQDRYLIVANFSLDAVLEEYRQMVAKNIFTKFLANFPYDNRNLKSTPPFSAFKPNGHDKTLEKQCWIDDFLKNKKPDYTAFRISGGA